MKNLQTTPLAFHLYFAGVGFLDLREDYREDPVFHRGADSRLVHRPSRREPAAVLSDAVFREEQPVPFALYRDRPMNRQLVIARVYRRSG